MFWKLQRKVSVLRKKKKSQIVTIKEQFHTEEENIILILWELSQEIMREKILPEKYKTSRKLKFYGIQIKMLW